MDLDNEELEAIRNLKVKGNDIDVDSIEKDIIKLKVLLYGGRLTLCGKRKLVKYYEDEIKKTKTKNEEYQKEIAELKEYILIAPNLDEMTATKYANIQREAYTKGRAEEQQRAEYVIYKNFIPKQKIKDKIEDLEKKMKYEQNEKALIHLHKQIKILKELLEDK